jgi:zinc/manganese transport system substrate-binding protein
MTLVGPNGDAHVFDPTAADAKTLAGADIFFANGLGFEGWIDRPRDLPQQWTSG